jgi:hypothetical protein
MFAADTSLNHSHPLTAVGWLLIWVILAALTGVKSQLTGRRNNGFIGQQT